jgi:hypothetical protein
MSTVPVAQQDSLRNKLVGTWTLVSSTLQRDGKTIEPFGPAPLGSMMFSEDGHFAVNFMRSDRPKFASNNREVGTAEENRSAVQGNISAFGTYKIETDGSVTFEIVASSFPNWDATAQRRLVEVNGDELKYSTPATSVGGSAVSTLIRAK